MTRFEQVILKMLKLDDNVVSLDIHLEGAKLPLIKVELMCYKDNKVIIENNEIVTITKQYELKEIEL